MLQPALSCGVLQLVLLNGTSTTGVGAGSALARWTEQTLINTACLGSRHSLIFCHCRKCAYGHVGRDHVALGQLIP